MMKAKPYSKIHEQVSMMNNENSSASVISTSKSTHANVKSAETLWLE